MFQFRIILFIGLLAFFLIGVSFQEPVVLLISVLLALIHNVIYSIKDLYKNIIFLCFNITFFIFLIGRMIVTEFFGYKKESSGILGLNFNDESIVNTINICLFLSLVALYLGYKLIQNVNLDFLKKTRDISNGFIFSARIFSLIYFYACIVIRFIYLLQLRNIVASEGYYETFISHNTSLPSYLVTISSTYNVAFFVYLSTFPSKRKSLFPVILFLTEGFLSALAGRRSDFILNILIVLIYYCVRSISSSESECENKKSERKWIGKFEWSLGIVSTPLLIVFMTIIGNLRAGINKSMNFLNSIYEFFFSQGVSANLIGYTKIYEKQIPENRNYTFGPFFEFIDNNIIRPLKGMPELAGQTVERALNGFSFSHTITFFIMPNLYLAGRGYGSSFVAELFHDFSYIGVFIGSIVYGAILYVFFIMIKNSYFIFTILTLLMTKSILFAPRDAYFSFIVDAFPPRNIFALIIILIGAKLLQSILSTRVINITLK